MYAFMIAIVILASARITHLLADDYILSKPRDWYQARMDRFPHLAYLVTCTWCMSIWVAGVVVLVLHDELHLHGWLAWAAWPALSYAVVLLEAVTEFLYESGSDE